MPKRQLLFFVSRWYRVLFFSFGNVVLDSLRILDQFQSPAVAVDLPGVLRMHILERIIRYVHDAKKSQKVEIIQWVAKLPVGSLMSIPAVSAIFEYWSKYEKMLMPTETFANVILTSPDQIVYARLQKILAEFHEVETLLLRASKNSQFPDPKCSLWEPNGRADPSRMPSCETFWNDRDVKAQVAGRKKSKKSRTK